MEDFACTSAEVSMDGSEEEEISLLQTVFSGLSALDEDSQMSDFTEPPVPGAFVSSVTHSSSAVPSTSGATVTSASDSHSASVDLQSQYADTEVSASFFTATSSTSTAEASPLPDHHPSSIAPQSPGRRLVVYENVLPPFPGHESTILAPPTGRGISDAVQGNVSKRRREELVIKQLATTRSARHPQDLIRHQAKMLDRGKVLFSKALQENAALHAEREDGISVVRSVTVDVERMRAQNAQLAAEFYEAQAQNAQLQSGFQQVQAYNAQLEASFQEAQARNVQLQVEFRDAQRESHDKMQVSDHKIWFQDVY